MIKNHSKCLQESIIIHELLTENKVTGQVAQDPHRLNLNLFVLSRQNVKLDAIKNGDTNVIGEYFSAWNVVEQDVGDAGDGVQDELFMLVKSSFINCDHQVGDEALNFIVLKLGDGIFFLCKQICQQFDNLGDCILNGNLAQLFVLLAFDTFLWLYLLLHLPSQVVLAQVYDF